MRPAARIWTPVALAAGTVALLMGLRAAGTPGWDASGHALAGLRMAEAVRGLRLDRFFDELLRAGPYPPLGRLGLGLGFLLDGRGFSAPRAASACAWILALGVAARLARRLVAERARPTASLWCVLFGLSSWVGVAHAREAFLESFAALAVGLVWLAWARALEAPSFRRDLACGLALGAAFLVKTPYGLQAIGVIGLVGALDLLPRAQRRRALRRAAVVALGLGAVLAWWLLLPLPDGFGRGAEHRRALVAHLSTAAGQSSHGPRYLLVAWPLMSYISLAAFAVQWAAFVWAALRWRERVPRLLLVAALIGPLAFVVFPLRLDRFLLPMLPAAWALAGGLCASALSHLAPRRRALLGAAAWILFVASAGLGAERVSRLAIPSLPSELPVEARATLDAIRRPWAARPAPAAGPAGLERVLDLVRAEVDARRSFTWIGGTTRELPLALLQWTLFAATGVEDVLWREPAEVDHLWTDPGWDEGAFRAWAAGFDQIGTLDPPDPLGRPDRAFEQRLVSWMARHPLFELAARREVELGGARRHAASIYVLR